MNTIEEVDGELTSYVKKVKDIAEEIEFSQICEFDLSQEGLSKIPWESLNYPGVYFIEIKNLTKHIEFTKWAQEFQEIWMDEKYRMKAVANPKKLRLEKHTTLSDWIPLYIGKSKNIRTRVNEHIHLGLEQRTFALKLGARTHLKDQKFRLSSIQVNVKNYDWVLPIFESTLRNRHNPIIGRQ